MRRKRISLIINKLARGGAETQCARLAMGLHERGWRVRVLTLLPSTAFTAELADLGIPVIDVSSGESIYHPHSIWRLLEQFWSYRQDVQVTFLYQSDMIGRVVGSFFSVPVRITSIRNEYFGSSGKPSDHWSVKLREMLMRLTDGMAHLSTTNSNIAAQSLIERKIVPANRMQVIRNMIDLKPFAPLEESERKAARADRGIDDSSTFVWVHAGRLETQKDQATLLRAFARQKNSHENVHLWLLGDGTRRDELDSLATELNVADHVIFAGEQSNVSEWLKAADGFVLSSKWEGLPNVLLEAGAARLPVVSTDVGGVREAISPEWHEYLTEAGSEEEMAVQLNRVVELKRDNSHHLAQLCEQNFRHVSETFGVEGVLDQWEGLFSDLMRDHLSEKRATRNE
jgi:glycosyltransferase involved in cell wall biosynthesis